MARVLLVRHEDGPDDDRVTSYLKTAGFAADIRRPFRGEPLGEVSEDIVGTVIYGGQYNAYDTGLHPFLTEEYRWIEAALAAGLPTLGLCQGAQMIAWQLGAWVGAPESGLHEFGYYRIAPLESDFMPAPLVCTQAHFHTFDLPRGAVHLARSEMFENQAFRLGTNVYGLQFHPEQTIEGFRRWQTALAHNYGRPGVQSREEQTELMHRHDAAQAEWFYGFLGRLFPPV